MTQALIPGERRPLAAAPTTVSVPLDLPGTDVLAFVLDERDRLLGDAYLVFYNNDATPDRLVRQLAPDRFVLDLERLPPAVRRVAFAASHDELAFSRLRRGTAVIEGGGQRLELRLEGLFGSEKAVILLEVYRKDAGWRVQAVAQGFRGGLADLVRHYGGQVDAPPAPTPAPPPPVPSVAPSPPPVPTVAPSPPPASPVSLSKLELRKREVGLTLKKLGIEGERARVAVVLDASGSMAALYGDGRVQDTLERLVPVAGRLDDDGELDVWFYATGFRRTPPVHEGNMAEYVKTHCPPAWKFGGGGIGIQNEEPKVMEDILTFYLHERPDPNPALVLFLTDGGIYRNAQIEAILKRASDHKLFWQFLGIGQAQYGVLERLDTLPGRRVDNAGFFAVDDLARITDQELYKRLLGEYPAWLRAARQSGVL